MVTDACKSCLQRIYALNRSKKWWYSFCALFKVAANIGNLRFERGIYHSYVFVYDLYQAFIYFDMYSGHSQVQHLCDQMDQFVSMFIYDLFEFLVYLDLCFIIVPLQLFNGIIILFHTLV